MSKETNATSATTGVAGAFGVAATMPTDNEQFTRYLTLQTLNALQFPKYIEKESLRFWFKDFEQEVISVGVSDFSHCCIHLARYMPDVIRQYIASINSDVKSSWDLLKEELLLHFGRPLEEENRDLLKQLRNYKQRNGESVKLFSAHWKHLLHLLGESQITSAQQVRLFTQGIKHIGLRTSLIAYAEIKEITTITGIIAKAIDLEDKAKLAEVDDFTTLKGPQESQPADFDPMEIDYVGSRKNKHYHNSSKKKFTSYRKNDKPKAALRLYDRSGNPICGYCQEKHRNIDCKMHNSKKNFYQTKKNYNKVNMVKDSSIQQDNQVDLDNPIQPVKSIPHITAADINMINHINSTTRPHAPVSTILVHDTKLPVLWDTGSTINIIDETIVKKFNWLINSNKALPYTDVNKNVNQTLGTVCVNLFGQKTDVQVIKGLARPIIIGYDLMAKWQTNIDIKTSVVSILVNNKLFRIKYSPNSHTNLLLTDIASMKTEVAKIVNKYKSLIATNTSKPRTTNFTKFSIDTEDHAPVYQAPRPYHPDIQKLIDNKLEELAKNGIISKTTFTEWGSPITAVDKADGSLRVCGNYVKLNAITRTIKYPFVNMHLALQSLGTSKIFSKIDLASGYCQIPIVEGDKVKTTLVTTTAAYYFNFLPFGLKNAPAVFQELMDKVLGPLRYQCAISYLDDILIFSESWGQHLTHLQLVLHQLEKANLSINLKKCQFALTTVEYLGFVVTQKRLTANKDKIKPILAIPAPQNLKELERFLGMTGVYQKFISKYQVITEPLRRLKKKDVDYIWGQQQQDAYVSLQNCLCNLPYLKQPNFKLQFELHCDAASSAGIGVILCQRYDNVPYPLSFASRSLSVHEQRYSIRELEALAIVWGIKKHRIYLERNEFLVFADHSSLQWLLNTSQDNQQGQDGRLKLLKENAEEDNSVKIINKVMYKILPKQRTITANNLFIIVPQHLVSEILTKFHCSEFAAHGGSKKTKVLLLKNGLWWKSMQADIVKFTKACDLCQRIKGNRSYNNHDLQPTSGESPFSKIAMDYFGPFPKSSRHNVYILVIIDTFSRYIELYPTKSTQSMEFAQIYYNNYVLRHGLSQEIICDNGIPFGSAFVQELAKYVNTQIKFTPPNFPAANGLVEKFMQSLRTMIQTFITQDHIVQEWDSKLKIIRFSFNNMWHSSTGFSPFELVHGRMARTPLTTSIEENMPSLYRGQETPQSHFAKNMLKNLQKSFEIVWSHRNLYQQENSSLRTPGYNVGDQVLIFNTQQSKLNNPRKLLFDWKGPLTITEKLSSTRINLKDMKSNKVLNNIHVSFIKPYYKQD